MPDTEPGITLNNGVELPALGFGVFQTPPDVTQADVEEVLRVGERAGGRGGDRRQRYREKRTLDSPQISHA